MFTGSYGECDRFGRRCDCQRRDLHQWGQSLAAQKYRNFRSGSTNHYVIVFYTHSFYFVLLPISYLQIHHSLLEPFYKKENFEFLLRVDCVFLCGKNLKAHQSGLGCGRAICLTKKRIVTPVRDSMLLLHPSGLAHQFLLQWKNARGARASDS